MRNLILFVMLASSAHCSEPGQRVSPEELKNLDPVWEAPQPPSAAIVPPRDCRVDPAVERTPLPDTLVQVPAELKLRLKQPEPVDAAPDLLGPHPLPANHLAYLAATDELRDDDSQEADAERAALKRAIVEQDEADPSAP